MSPIGVGSTVAMKIIHQIATKVSQAKAAPLNTPAIRNLRDHIPLSLALKVKEECDQVHGPHQIPDAQCDSSVLPAITMTASLGWVEPSARLRASSTRHQRVHARL